MGLHLSCKLESLGRCLQFKGNKNQIYFQLSQRALIFYIRPHHGIPITSCTHPGWNCPFASFFSHLYPGSPEFLQPQRTSTSVLFLLRLSMALLATAVRPHTCENDPPRLLLRALRCCIPNHAIWALTLHFLGSLSLIFNINKSYWILCFYPLPMRTCYLQRNRKLLSTAGDKNEANLMFFAMILGNGRRI